MRRLSLCFLDDRPWSCFGYAQSLRILPLFFSIFCEVAITGVEASITKCDHPTKSYSDPFTARGKNAAVNRKQQPGSMYTARCP